MLGVLTFFYDDNKHILALVLDLHIAGDNANRIVVGEILDIKLANLSKKQDS